MDEAGSRQSNQFPPHNYLGQLPGLFSPPALVFPPGPPAPLPSTVPCSNVNYERLPGYPPAAPDNVVKVEGQGPGPSMLDSAAPSQHPTPPHLPPQLHLTSSPKCNGTQSPPDSGSMKSTSSSGTSPVMTTSSGDVHHLLSAVDTEMLAGSEKGDPTEQQLSVTLEDRDLWLKFKEFTNEMIVTKNGRRMFPVFRCSVTGLDPSAMYTFLLDFVQVDSHRWKYVNGDWVAGGKAEPAVPNCVYIHPDSPNFGAHWMKEVVTFSKVKLTNKMNGGGQIMLNSLHKYEPRLHIIKVNQRNNQQNKDLLTFSFNETQFIAVTAYQNEEITALKIKYNPFAKAFLDAKERPDQRDLMDEGGCDGQGRALSHFPGTWYLPTGGHGLVPPPAHQFTSHLGLSNAGCDRLALRNARPSPYPTYQRRSPPHSSNFSRDMGNLSMFNLPEQWSNMGMGTQALLSGGGTGSVGMGQSMGGQYPSMWMSSAVGNLGNVSQSCAMPPYLRSGGPGGYSLPPVTAPPSVSSPSGGLGGALPTGAGGAGGMQPQCEQPYDLGAYTSAARDQGRSAPSWGPLTPPPL
ncbi:T-box transcription factor T-like [Babylonia areolata]|uniref:T-box transcription factor T-like n=1 Tax=Babylonia areolata TaxID=304850 RepID=UPI003FD55F8E